MIRQSLIYLLVSCQSHTRMLRCLPVSYLRLILLMDHLHWSEVANAEGSLAFMSHFISSLKILIFRISKALI